MRYDRDVRRSVRHLLRFAILLGGADLAAVACSRPFDTDDPLGRGSRGVVGLRLFSLGGG
jgi:hypothetical protein